MREISTAYNQRSGKAHFSDISDVSKSKILRKLYSVKHN